MDDLFADPDGSRPPQPGPPTLDEVTLRTCRAEALAGLAGGIAHSLNNTLAPVVIATRLLEADLSRSQRLEILRQVNEATRQSMSLIKQIVWFARTVEQGSGRLDFKHLVQEAARFARPIFSPGIQVEADYPADLPTLHGDPVELFQLLLTLLAAARKALGDRGIIHLVVGTVQGKERLPQRQIVVEIGLEPPTGAAPLLEPAVSVSCLEILRGIARRHGGSVETPAASPHTLPCRVRLPADPEEEAPRPQPPPPDGAGELILLVEPADELRAVIAKSLELHGYRVAGARDAGEALAWLQGGDTRPELAIVAFELAETSGRELLDRLRSIRPGLPAVLLGADPEAASDGPDALLRKPFALDTLLHAVARAVGHGTG